MKKIIRSTLDIVLVFILTTCSVWAGSQQRIESHLPVEDLVKLTKKLEKTMAAKGVRVFLIARTGIPKAELPEDVEYTHVAFGVYSKIKTDNNRIVPGYAYYNLYQIQDDSSKSKLVIDYTIDFISGIYEPKVGVLVPVPELQKRLLSIIGTDSYLSLHNPEYSVLANPYDMKYQNCTEFVLDVINASIYNTINKEILKLNAKKYFEGQKINISPIKLLLGSIFSSDIKTSDHNGQIRTATFTSIVNYLKENNLAAEVMTIKL